MNRFLRAWIALAGMLLGSQLAASSGFAQPEPPTPAVPQATGAHQVFVPMLGPGAPPPAQPPPTQPPPAGRTGFFALNDRLTYNAATAIDAQGVVHLAFYASDEHHPHDPLGLPAFYTSCRAGVAACADPARWAPLVTMDDGVNEVQIAVTRAGQPRLLVRRNGQRGYEYDYWACDQQCSTPANWSGLRVNEAAGVELNNARMPQRSFALDSQDRPRYVWSNGWGNNRLTGVYYAWCDAADCTQPESWQHGLIANLANRTVTADYAVLLFHNDQPRVLTRINYSGLPVEVRYYECQLACQQSSDWWYSTLPHPADRQWASWDLALDGQGRPRVALYEPAGIDITVGGRLFYGWCDGVCFHTDDPFSLVQVAAGEGLNVDLAIDGQGRTHLVYDAGQRGALGQLWCTSNCTVAAAWQRRILETSEQLMGQFAPASPLSCSQQERAWFDAIPQVAFDRQGRMAVAYDITNYARCYTIDPSDPTRRIYSEVKRIWWAVRWVQFA
ncbi:MAG TPA: hypothetical protein PKC19_14255, partial [Roseiflexaceae bacterium]|nr:hypothetical protein [Roseiflexaceae bacterium]